MLVTQRKEAKNENCFLTTCWDWNIFRPVVYEVALVVWELKLTSHFVSTKLFLFQILQNLGKADKTTDEIFEEHLQNFNTQQVNATRLHKDINNYLRCIRGESMILGEISGHSRWSRTRFLWRYADTLPCFVTFRDLIRVNPWHFGDWFVLF